MKYTCETLPRGYGGRVHWYAAIRNTAGNYAEPVAIFRTKGDAVDYLKEKPHDAARLAYIGWFSAYARNLREAISSEAEFIDYRNTERHEPGAVLKTIEGAGGWIIKKLHRRCGPPAYEVFTPADTLACRARKLADAREWCAKLTEITGPVAGLDDETIRRLILEKHLATIRANLPKWKRGYYSAENLADAA